MEFLLLTFFLQLVYEEQALRRLAFLVAGWCTWWRWFQEMGWI